jgi:hypothetical protein
MSSTQTTFRFNPIRVLMSLPSDCAILTDIDWTPLNEAAPLAPGLVGGVGKGAEQVRDSRT